MIPLKYYMKKILTKILILLLIIAIPTQARSAMRSSSYVIYENVMHNFSGPVISSVTSSVSGISATITWNTDVASDAFVIYDTNSDFSTSREQGYSAKINTAHSVSISGLVQHTTYYFRVRSERVNGGITTDIASRSFTTGSDGSEPAPAEEETSQVGGGILVIDKTDKFAPEISGLSVNNINEEQVTIIWNTNEVSTSFVEFGLDESYGQIVGQWDESMEHSVTVDNLKSGREYHFRVISSDSWGNVGRSDDDVFVIGEKMTEEEIIEEEKNEEENIKEESINAIEDAKQKALEFLRRLFPEISLNELKENGLDNIADFEDLENFIPMPILSGEPRVEIGATEATIFWRTDSDSTSQVAVAPDGYYNQSANEPYQQIVGDIENLTTNHQVKVYGLSPNTLYHYQLRSKGKIGPMAVSRDFTFKTNIEELSISNYYSNVEDTQTAVFKWITNKEADSEIKFSPYHGDTISYEETKIVKNNEISLIHEIKIGEFQAGIFYEIEIASTDAKGNRAIETIKRFSTSEEDLPPEISNIKADSTIFIDKSDKIQTVISWLTNEPATSRVYFQEGVYGGETELLEKTDLNSSYAREHIMVIPKFKPGLVYSFRVESIDSGGNISMSKLHTFMTAKKKESIIQIIMRILEDTFGWVKNI